MATIPIRPTGNLKGAINVPGTFSLTGFNLQSGVTYAILTTGSTEGGGTLPNPDEAVFDANGAGQPVNLLAYNNNSFLSVDPLIQFTPKVSGEYIVAVGGLGGTGTFSLHVTPAGPPSLISKPPAGALFDIEPAAGPAGTSLADASVAPVDETPPDGAVNLDDITQGLASDNTMAFLADPTTPDEVALPGAPPGMTQADLSSPGSPPPAAIMGDNTVPVGAMVGPTSTLPPPTVLALPS